MPQRFLRPGITTSKRWNRCDWASQTLFARLITLVDDYGRYDADPELIRSHAFPFGDPNGKVMQLTAVARMLRTLADKDLVILYQKDGKEYLQVSRWQERVRSASKFPDPPCEQMTANDSKCSPPSPSSSPLAISHKPSVDECESIYAAYPRKVAKPEALRAIEKAISRGTPPTILLQRTKLFASTTDLEIRFIPHPATWFNQERFNDDPSTWKNGQRRGARPDKPTKANPAKIDVPERFKVWVATKYPDKREEAMRWQTWADVPPYGLRQEWWDEEKKKLPVEI